MLSLPPAVDHHQIKDARFSGHSLFVTLKLMKRTLQATSCQTPRSLPECVLQFGAFQSLTRKIRSRPLQILSGYRPALSGQFH